MHWEEYGINCFHQIRKWILSLNTVKAKVNQEQVGEYEKGGPFGATFYIEFKIDQSNERIFTWSPIVQING